MITFDAVYALFMHLDKTKQDYDDFKAWHKIHGQGIVCVSTLNSSREDLLHISDVLRFLKGSPYKD